MNPIRMIKNHIRSVIREELNSSELHNLIKKTQCKYEKTPVRETTWYLGSKIFTHTVDGHRVFLDPDNLHMTTHMLERRVWEDHVRDVLRRVLKPGSTFVDVGANIGLHAVYAADLVGNTGKVIVFEPNPSTFELLFLNMELNGFLDRTVFFNKAAGAKDELLQFEIRRGRSGMSGINIGLEQKTVHENSFFHDSEMISVETIPLDNVLHEINPDVIKIDVEGFELDVLSGAVSTLSGSESVLVLEWHGPVQYQRTELLDTTVRMLKDIGYNNYYIARWMNDVEHMASLSIEKLKELNCDLVLSKYPLY